MPQRTTTPRISMTAIQPTSFNTVAPPLSAYFGVTPATIMYADHTAKAEYLVHPSGPRALPASYHMAL
jgi:hypothetical protein